ncbi:hypothetical protein [Hymenobacter baengnokdamensis]|uniref:hypothetical protein n=1 Tax=Hymenobacter baengnokdamensis TaxID=2615203 RepID=UPI0012455F12|nr:hypothetical protein [Hymenobacter baengnokdamensis]
MKKDQLARHRRIKQVLTDNDGVLISELTFAKIAKQYIDRLALLDGMCTSPNSTPDTGTGKYTVSALNVFLKKDLRSGIESLKSTHPNFYKALREANQADDAWYRHSKKRPSLTATTLSSPIATEASVMLSGGIASVFLNDDGTVRMELTVSTDCVWAFTLASSPTTVHEQQNSLHDMPHRTDTVGEPSDLIGKPYAWSLHLINEAPEKTLPYHVELYLFQDGNQQPVYSYTQDGEIDPASGTADAFLGQTLSYRR